MSLPSASPSSSEHSTFFEQTIQNNQQQNQINHKQQLLERRQTLFRQQTNSNHVNNAKKNEEEKKEENKETAQQQSQMSLDKLSRLAMIKSAPSSQQQSLSFRPSTTLSSFNSSNFLPSLASAQSLPLTINLHLPSTPNNALSSLTLESNSRMQQWLTSIHDDMKWKGIQGMEGTGEEKRVEKLLSAWERSSTKKHHHFKTISQRIDTVIAERNAVYDVYIGKLLIEDIYQRDEIEKRKYSFYKIHVPATATTLKVEVEITEGRIEMFVSNTEMYSFARDRDYQWLQRCATGHHSLLIVNSDPQWKSSADYYISILAVSNTTLMIKANCSGKIGTVRGIAGTKTNITTKHQPSEKNIRKALNSKIKNLKENPKLLKEFHQKILQIKRESWASYRDDDNTPGIGGEKNFLLENSLYAIKPVQDMKQLKQQWLEQHSERLSKAEIQHYNILQHRKETTEQAIAQRNTARERARIAAQYSRQQAELQHIQTLWLLQLTVVTRNLYWISQFQNLTTMRIERKRRTEAAIVIQHFIRRALKKRKQIRAQFHLQAFRSMILVCAYNQSVVKKDRAANIIKLFLEQISGVDSIARIVKNYRIRVATCQRAVKRHLAVRSAKLKVWSKQIEQTLKKESNMSIVPETLNRLLSEHFDSALKLKMRALPQYHRDLSEWQQHQQMESAKKMVIRDHIEQKLPKPVKPHVPAILEKKFIQQIIREGARKNDDLSHNTITSPLGRRGTVLRKRGSVMHHDEDGNSSKTSSSSSRHGRTLSISTAGSSHQRRSSTSGNQIGSPGNSSLQLPAVSAVNSRPTSGRSKTIA